MPQRIIGTKLNLIPVLLALFGFVVLIYGLALLGQTGSPANRSSRAGSPASNAAPDIITLQKQLTDLSVQLDGLKGSREALNDRFDALSQKASQAQWLLAIVLGAAGLLTVAQGFFAFFSAQNYVKQADDAIKRATDATTKVEKLAEDVQRRFPIFAHTESARAEAFSDLSKLTPALDIDQNLYVKSDPLIRQKIFAIESFSAVQFLALAEPTKDLIRNLQLLGKFYAGKFSSEAHQLQSDFERSYYYLDLAAQKSLRSFSVLNDLGWLFGFVANPKDADKGRAFFEESLRSRPDQQRALYNLGTLAFDKGDRAKLERARDYLQRARQQTNWEDGPNHTKASHIDYNLACVYDSLCGLENDPAGKSALLDECAKHLETAAPYGAQPKETVEEDLNTGDLMNFGASQPHAPRRNSILSMYRAAWQAH